MAQAMRLTLIVASISSFNMNAFIFDILFAVFLDTCINSLYGFAVDWQYTFDVVWLQNMTLSHLHTNAARTILSMCPIWVAVPLTPVCTLFVSILAIWAAVPLTPVCTLFVSIWPIWVAVPSTSACTLFTSCGLFRLLYLWCLYAQWSFYEDTPVPQEPAVYIFW